MSTTATDVVSIGQDIAELCRNGNFHEAVEKYYSPNIVSIEAQGSDEMPARMEGIEAIRGKGEWWVENNEVHNVEVTGPFPKENQFVLNFKLDVTPKAGEMAGHRFTMEEAGLYTVEDGKIIQEEFFYSMG